MAKWAQPSDETQKTITDVLITVGLDELIDTKIIVNDEQLKKVIDIKKETPANKFAYGYDLKLTVNESIFDLLPDDQRLLIIHEALSGTHYDYENEKLVVTQPDKVHRCFIDKYGWDKHELLIESVKSLYEVKKNEANLEK
tara:strand:+ start:205 stop:627 length:423 start_codon:yes stop_codon:yes gene_type:complete